MGKEMVVYDSVMAESREVGNESMSTDEFLGCVNVVVENLEEPVLNDDLISDIDVDESDEAEPILLFKQTKPMMKPPTHQIKHTTSPNVHLTLPLPRLRTRSSGHPMILPFPDDTVESCGKKKKPAHQSTKTTA